MSALRTRFEAYGQDHVFRFWDRLDPPERDALATQAARLDLEALAGMAALSRDPAPPVEAEPAPVERHPARGGDARRWAEAAAVGDARLRAGDVGFLTMAGGQGSRLGLPGPKGSFPIGPVTDRTLFEVHAQKIRGIQVRTGRAAPWILLTSPENDAATRVAFEDAGFFGLDRAEVFFAVQRALPALDFDGKLLLARRDRIFESPDGHGGMFDALADADLFEALRARGVDLVMTFQVDNPLVRVGEPALLGHHTLGEAEMSSKVLAKRDPDDRMGVPVLREGRAAVVEYSELPDAMRHARDAAGELVYWAGSYAVHVLSVAFASDIADDAARSLPLHVATKRIPHVGADGATVEPASANGHKFERFVFDALPHARRAVFVEGLREDEYAPVKNPDVEGGECPRHTREALSALYRRWLAAAGVPTPPGATIEIDHAYADGPDDLLAHRLQRIEDAGDAIRSEAPQ